MRLVGAYGNGGGEGGVEERVAYVHGEVRGADAPGVGLGVVEGKGAGVERDGEVAGLAGGELDTVEALELFGGAGDDGFVFGEVELGDVGAGAGAGVGDVEGGGGGGDVEVGEGEGGIRHAIAEGEQGLGAVVLVAAIADVEAFGVGDGFRAGGGVVGVEGGIVFCAALEGSGEVAGGVGLAEEDFGEGLAAGLAGVPGFEVGGDAVEEAGGIDVAAGGDGDDGFGVGGGEFADELGLSVGQIEGTVAAFGLALLLEAGGDDDGVRVGGESQGAGVDDVLFRRDGEEEMAADGAALPFFDDDLVRAGGELESDVGLEGADERPVVNDEFVVHEDAVAAAFAGIFKGYDVAAGSGSGVETSEAMRDFAFGGGKEGSHGAVEVGEQALDGGAVEHDTGRVRGKGGGAADVEVGEGFEGDAFFASGGGGGEPGFRGEVAEGGNAAIVEDLDVGAEESGDAFERADEVERHDAGAAAANGSAGVSVGADNEDGFDGGFVEGEDVALVFEQDGAFAGGLEGDGLITSVEEGDGVVTLVAVEPAVGGGGLEEVTYLVVEGGLSDGACLEGGGEIGGVHEFAGGHFDIEATVGGADGIVGGVPVGHENTLEVPVVAEDVDVEVGVFGGVKAVDEVVGIHDGGNVALFYGGFESGKVDFVHRAVVDDGVGIVAEEFGVIAEVVLDGGGDPLRLKAGDVAGGYLSGEEGVFAEVFEVAAIAGRAVDVDAGAEHIVDAAGAGVAAYAGTDFGGEGAVPRGGEIDAGGKRSGGEAGVGTDAVGAVGHFKGGDVEGGNGADPETGAADVVELLGEGHGMDKGFDVLLLGRSEGVRGLSGGGGSGEKESGKSKSGESGGHEVTSWKVPE